jgi:hypothetical protein
MPVERAAFPAKKNICEGAYWEIARFCSGNVLANVFIKPAGRPNGAVVALSLARGKIGVIDSWLRTQRLNQLLLPDALIQV